jgi:phosphoribosylformylglycinamidine cyclo-ligase
MTLAGGETAQLPGLYTKGHYDLAGTIVGVVSEAAALHGDLVKLGDVLIGYASNGLHTNGYTLARRVIFDELKLDVASLIPAVGQTVGDALLAVHRSYWAAISPVVGRIHALAHITGGGIAGNLARSLPAGCHATVERGSWKVPDLFEMLRDAGRIDIEEMYRVFNMGVGMIAVADPGDVDKVRRAAQAAKVQTFLIGNIVAGDGVSFR